MMEIYLVSGRTRFLSSFYALFFCLAYNCVPDSNHFASRVILHMYFFLVKFPDYRFRTDELNAKTSNPYHQIVRILDSVMQSFIIICISTAHVIV